eukprot:EG_transcript_5231
MENVSQKNLEHLEQWLSERGLKKYYSVLVQHEVFSVRDLALLTSEDLIEIGIEAVGSRRKLLCHTAQLRSDLGEKARSSSVTSLPPIDQKRTNNVMQEVQLTDEDDTDAPLKEIAQEVENWEENGSPIGLEAKADSLPSMGKLDKEASVGKATPPQIQEPLQESSIKLPKGTEAYAKEVENVVQGLKGEADVLQSIADSANLLLTYEKEDSVANETYIAGKLNASHTMSVDVAYFRNRMQKRIDQYMKDPSPPPSPREQARKWGADYLARGRRKQRIDYTTLIQQQTATHELMEKVYARYQELLQQCLDSVADHIDRHSSVGEYRDIGEYRLKMQLARLIGMAGPEDDVVEDEAHHARLGITEATLARRRSTAQHLEKMVEAVAGSGDRIVKAQQLQEACEKDAELRAQLQVLAFNLALDPENRFVCDDDKLNAEIQAELEEIAQRLRKDHDGLITKEQIDNLPPHIKRALMRYGLPAIFAT